MVKEQPEFIYFDIKKHISEMIIWNMTTLKNTRPRTDIVLQPIGALTHSHDSGE